MQSQLIHLELPSDKDLDTTRGRKTAEKVERCLSQISCPEPILVYHKLANGGLI